mmetsp:Transcript_29158/g.67608  ORF Transcript_29158/g.67608 Transcript_29158/m.67608 type:complete len:96 (-) Transcript_29158:153-440(-)
MTSARSWVSFGVFLQYRIHDNDGSRVLCMGSLHGNNDDDHLVLGRRRDIVFCLECLLSIKSSFLLFFRPTRMAFLSKQQNNKKTNTMMVANIHMG